MKHYKSATSRRIARVRGNLFGTPTRPRLSVDRTNKHLLVQLIDDEAHRTILGVSTQSIKEGKTKTEKAVILGKQVAEKAKEKKIEKALFDRGGFRYGGRIRALADAARKNGLTI